MNNEISTDDDVRPSPRHRQAHRLCHEASYLLCTGAGCRHGSQWVSQPANPVANRPWTRCGSLTPECETFWWGWGRKGACEWGRHLNHLHQSCYLQRGPHGRIAANVEPKLDQMENQKVNRNLKEAPTDVSRFKSRAKETQAPVRNRTLPQSSINT